MNAPHDSHCAFCAIVARKIDASIVWEDELTMAFMDLRQFNEGHVLIISREHLSDLRDANDATAAAVVLTVKRVMRAVAATFPNDGLSVWHSAGEGANQEVPHLHFHVHPRHVGDGVLRVYPAQVPTPSREHLEQMASKLRVSL